ncbi:hypothetical protein PMIN06_005417 [Paraphaeosphaeria minitans]|uniref:DUF7730 domain-containing protein n=1 Tax=Paraphaeosphaeria minitans TaxID=565426 RepID=A0A9P6GDJ0_9PLEO|nr:hypothetical protein PMIN01_08717 [Paraphaeosphaeria minitans]
MATSTQSSSLLFRLPLEIREQIYHHVFLYFRCMHAAFPTSPQSFTGSQPHLNNLTLRYPLTDPNCREQRYASGYEDFRMDWIMTCKAIFSEALEQFTRNAEFVVCGKEGIICRDCRRCSPQGMLTSAINRHWTTRIPVNTARIRKMEVNVDNLTNFETPKRYEHWDECDGIDTTEQLKELSEFMRAAHMQLDTLRFIGNSYQLRGAGKRKIKPSIWTSGSEQTGDIMRQLMSFFDRIKVHRWELGIVDMPNWNSWVLFEWVGSEGLRIMRNEGRQKPPDPKPEEDLVNLLPPGWVLKIPTCGDEDCDDCNPL